MSSRQWVAAVTGALIITSVVLAPTGSAATPARPSLDEVTLSAYSTQDVITSLKPAERKGYSSIRIDDASRKVEVRWKGKPSGELLRLLRQKHLADDVVMLPAVYDQKELKAAVKAVMQAGPAEVQVNGATLARQDIVAAGPRTDGSGLTLRVAALALNKVSASRATAERSEPSAEGTLTHSARTFPVDISPAADIQPAVSRDEAPTEGGHVIHLNGGTCTSAFNVYNAAGKLRALTARHCGAKGSVVSDSNYQPFGVVETSNTAHDVSMFDNSRSSMRFSPTVVGGGSHNALWQTTYNVRHGMSVIQGSPVCVSGAYSGERCMGLVTQVAMTVMVAGNLVDDLYWVRSVPYKEATVANTLAGPGDSGAPVYVKVAYGDTYRAAPVGILSSTYGAIYTDRCPANNITFGSKRLCSSEILVVDLYEAMQSIGADEIYTVN
ncbi:S1 family peptidase [Kineosporia sp. NBRC 101731]|uniref:S1 family peptidase n=1 Tax=Kineosporia sp. NBRC 101731 TaxID=3032199 RepID=UPI0024A4FB61|nr:S1 family peptidase [Kineosporia sp. NBRC 101731]GLY28847.1 hypothetical protein Kisp02_22120 [Kineosporia sp. NBRC 101731]